MEVSRLRIAARGLTNRCPNCGGKTLFQEGKLFDVNPACPRCGLKIDRDEGFYLGSLSLNYAVTLICFLLPDLILAWKGVLSVETAAIAACVGAVVVPALLYRSSRSWWLMQYYLLFPHHLPQNLQTLSPKEDENV